MKYQNYTNNGNPGQKRRDAARDLGHSDKVLIMNKYLDVSAHVTCLPVVIHIESPFSNLLYFSMILAYAHYMV